MTTLKAMISNNTGVSSNRAINITMVIWMLLVMLYAILFSVPIETLSTVLEYSFYIYASSLTTKSIEKVTSIIKSKNAPNNTI